MLLSTDYSDLPNNFAANPIISFKQDSKDLNPRSLANTQFLNSTNALTILTSSNAPERFKVYKRS